METKQLNINDEILCNFIKGLIAFAIIALAFGFSFTLYYIIHGGI